MVGFRYLIHPMLEIDGVTFTSLYWSVIWSLPPQRLFSISPSSKSVLYSPPRKNIRTSFGSIMVVGESVVVVMLLRLGVMAVSVSVSASVSALEDDLGDDKVRREDRRTSVVVTTVRGIRVKRLFDSRTGPSLLLQLLLPPLLLLYSHDAIGTISGSVGCNLGTGDQSRGCRSSSSSSSLTAPPLRNEDDTTETSESDWVMDVSSMVGNCDDDDDDDGSPLRKDVDRNCDACDPVRVANVRRNGDIFLPRERPVGVATVDGNFFRFVFVLVKRCPNGIVLGMVDTSVLLGVLVLLLLRLPVLLLIGGGVVVKFPSYVVAVSSFGHDASMYASISTRTMIDSTFYNTDRYVDVQICRFLLQLPLTMIMWVVAVDLPHTSGGK